MGALSMLGGGGAQDVPMRFTVMDYIIFNFAARSSIGAQVR